MGYGRVLPKEAFKRKMATKVYKISWNDNCEEDYKKIEEAITTRVPLELNLKSAKATMPCVDFKKIIPIPEEFEGESPLGKEGLENKARDFIRTLALVELAKQFDPEKAAGLTMASQEVQEEIGKFFETVKSIRLRRALVKIIIENERLLDEAFAKKELCQKLSEWTDRHYKKGTALIISIIMNGTFDCEDWKARNWEAEQPKTIGFGRSLVILTETMTEHPKIIQEIQERLDSIDGLSQRATITDITKEYFLTKDLPREQRKPKNVLWLDEGSPFDQFLRQRKNNKPEEAEREETELG